MADVNVLDPSGRPGTIPEDQLEAAKAQGFAEAPQEGPQQSALYKVGEGIYNVGETLESGFRGVMRGATAGLSEAADKALLDSSLGKAIYGETAGKEYAATTAREKAEHPLVNAAGEVTGMVGGAFAGEGAGALTTPLGLLGSAGKGAASVAERLAGGLAERGVLGRAAAGAAKLGAQGAVENALYSGIQEASEESLGDPELNAEKIWAATSHGAEGGLLLGGLLGGGGSLAKSGVSFAHDMASTHADKLTELANDQRWRALDPLKKFSVEANARVEGGTNTVGEVLGKYDIIPGDIKTAAKAGGIEHIAPKIDEAVDAIGKKIGEVTAASDATIPLQTIDTALEKTIEPIRKKAGFEGVVRSLEDYRNSLTSHLEEGANADATVSLQDALFQRKALDELVYKETRALDPSLRVEALRGIRSDFEGVIVDAFDKAATEAGNPGAKAELLGLKKDYQALSIAKDAVETSTARMATNRNFSLSDYLSGGAASHVGAAVGGFVGGAPGAMIGGMVGGAAGAAINRLGRERGNAVAAAALDRLAAFGGKSRITVRLPEAAQALAKEAAAAEGVATKEGGTLQKVTSAVPNPIPVEAKEPEPIGGFRQKMDDSLMREIGVQNHPDNETLEALGHKIFGDKVPDAEFWKNMWRVPEGYSLKINEMTGIKALGVTAEILDKDGKVVGQLERHFFKDPGKPLEVQHSYMSIDPAAQGQGIGSEIQKSSLESYHRLGVGQVNIHASLDVGPYAWARHKGFEMTDESKGDLHWSAKEWAHAKQLPPSDLQALNAAIDKSPYAITELPFGKEFLLNSGGWYGHMNVNAAMLEKAAQFERAQAAIKKTDTEVKAAAKGIVEGPKAAKTPYRSPAEPLKQRFDDAVKKVQEVSQNADALTARAVVPLTHLPKTGSALGRATLRAASYLVTQMPTSPVRPSLGMMMPTRVSDTDMNAFLEKYQAATQPFVVLKAFASGRITPGQAKAVQAVSPAIFAALQKEALDVIQVRKTSKDPLPFDARQRMSILLGIVTDPSQDPKMMKALQANVAMAAPSPAGQASGGSTGGLPLNTSKFDSLEEK